MKLKTLTILTFCLLLIQTSKAQKVLTLNVGHNERITNIEFSPDGKYILSSDGVTTGGLYKTVLV